MEEIRVEDFEEEILPGEVDTLSIGELVLFFFESIQTGCYLGVYNGCNRFKMFQGVSEYEREIMLNDSWEFTLLAHKQMTCLARREEEWD